MPLLLKQILFPSLIHWVLNILVFFPKHYHFNFYAIGVSFPQGWLLMISSTNSWYCSQHKMLNKTETERFYIPKQYGFNNMVQRCKQTYYRWNNMDRVTEKDKSTGNPIHLPHEKILATTDSWSKKQLDHSLNSKNYRKKNQTKNNKTM